VTILVESLGLARVDFSRKVSQPLFSLRSPPPCPTRAIKSTKTPPISVESVLRACWLYELSYTRFGALFLAVLSCFSPDFVLLRPHVRRDRHPTIFRLHGTPPSSGHGDIFGGNLDATILRDTVPSRSYTSATPPLLRPPVLLHPLFGYGNIFGGYLDATSFHDTVPSRSCTSTTPLVGLRA
jgi:hypothetical protein